MPILPRPHARTAWLVVIGGACVLTIAGLAWWLSTSPGELRDHLRQVQFWSLETQFLILAGLSVMNGPRLLRALGLRPRDYLAPALCSILALILVFAVAPRTNRIYYDEHIYQGVAQNLADLKLAQMCNDGTVEYGTLQCWRGEYNKEPYGYPYLLSVAYRVAGVDERVAFVMNGLAAAATIWIVFLLTTALTGHADAGGFAALIAAMIPEQLRWAHTAAAEPAAALGAAFAVLTAAAFVRLRTTAALLWTTSATVFAAQLRPEGFLVAGVVAVVIVAFAAGELRRPPVWLAAILGLVLGAVHIAHMLAVRHEGWGATGPRFSVAYFLSNLQVNGGFFLGDPRFPVMYTLLALAGVLGFRPWRPVAVLLVYFGLFWGIFLVFYAGSYNYGADDRFSLMTFPAVAAIAGVGAATLASLAAQRWPISPSSVRMVIIALLVFQFTWYLPFVRATGEEAWGARADVSFAKSLLPDLPPNSYVLTHNPNMFHLWGVNAGQASIATNETPYLTNVLARRYAGGIFFYWNFWCNVADPVQQSFCAGILKQFPHTLVRQQAVRDYRYALYRLMLPDRPSESK